MKKRFKNLRSRYQRALHVPMAPQYARRINHELNPDHQRVLLFEVHHALTRGLTVPECAALLDIKEKTVEALRDKARRFDGFTFDLHTQEYVAKRFWLSCEDRVKKLWAMFSATRNEHIKIKCVALVHLIEQDMVKMGQSLGLIGQFDAENQPEMALKAKQLLERYQDAVGDGIVDSRPSGTQGMGT